MTFNWYIFLGITTVIIFHLIQNKQRIKEKSKVGRWFYRYIFDNAKLCWLIGLLLIASGLWDIVLPTNDKPFWDNFWSGMIDVIGGSLSVFRAIQSMQKGQPEMDLEEDEEE